MPDPSLDHISLTCDDPNAVERLYTKHFGFRRARVVDLDQGAQIVFLGAPEGDGYPWAGVRNFSFQVDDVERKIAEMGSEQSSPSGR